MNITITEYLTCFTVKFKIKCLPASWLSIAFSDTDLMLQLCLLYYLQNYEEPINTGRPMTFYNSMPP